VNAPAAHGGENVTYLVHCRGLNPRVIQPAPASFLLAVLFVTGPCLGRRAIAKAIIVVFAVQSALELAPMVRPPFEPVYLLATPGPIFTPLGDVVLLCGIATALWIHPLPS